MQKDKYSNFLEEKKSEKKNMTEIDIETWKKIKRKAKRICKK